MLRKETHGTINCYQVGCRCEDCRSANATFYRHQQNDRTDRAIVNPALVPHGTTGGYRNWGCRCDSCRAANTETCRTYKKARASADSPGTTRKASSR